MSLHNTLTNLAKDAINAIIEDPETPEQIRYYTLKDLIVLIEDGIRETIPNHIREEG